MFGNFWASSINGVKLQDNGSCFPGTTSNSCFAPGITLFLLDEGVSLVDQTVTDQFGRYSFDNVAPGFYTITEGTGPLNPALVSQPVVLPIIVQQGQVIVANAGLAPVDETLPYSEVVNANLGIRNLLYGSVHGVVANPDGTPAVGVGAHLKNLSTGVVLKNTTTNAQGQFNFEDVLPGIYHVTVDGFIDPELVVITSGEEEMALTGQAALEPGQFATINANLIFGNFAGDTTPPTVTEILLSNPGWSGAYLGAAPTPDPLGEGVPISAGSFNGQGNVTELIVEFSEPVRGSAGDGSLVPFNPLSAVPTPDVRLVGGKQGNVKINSILVDTLTNRARLILDKPLGNDRYELRIGDWVTDDSGNKLDGDGNTLAGGIFKFPFNLLPGDSNGDGVVLSADMNIVGGAWMSSVGDANYDWRADTSGDGVVLSADLNNLGTYWMQTLPARARRRFRWHLWLLGPTSRKTVCRPSTRHWKRNSHPRTACALRGLIESAIGKLPRFRRDRVVIGSTVTDAETPVDDGIEVGTKLRSVRPSLVARRGSGSADDSADTGQDNWNSDIVDDIFGENGAF